MNAGQDKYLILHIPPGVAGIDHILAVVKNAIKEAIHLKRVLVIDKYPMARHHNLGHKLENLDIERYINLSKTQIYKIENNGSIEQIHNVFRYIRMENFDHNKYPEETILQLPDTPISEAQNNQHKVIVRTTANDSYNRQVHSNMLIVAFYPSDKVARLTDIVLRAMGTSLSDTEKLSAVYTNIDFATNKETWQDTVLDNPLHYACLHVRGNDTSGLSCFKQAASESHIRSIVKQKIPRGMRIYLMTDIKKPGYLSFLKKDYTVYRYYDFPELKDLVSGNKSPVDNAMLYSVEKNIMQHAYVKLVRADGTFRVICTGCIHKIRWRYKILSMIDLLSSRAVKRCKARINRLIGQ